MVILGLPAGPRSRSGPDHWLHFLGRLLGPEEYCMVIWAFLKLHGLSEWAALSHWAFQIASFIRPGWARHLVSNWAFSF
ncbi:hypothetical protein AXF42_Ash013347 [Apostasia shenzhenica]|uniref:Uncharacterized protein n=1 Tax=Apostasia shenzhenica TaxID=1088818 RepID=A0A2I0BBQ0_9ASPA|nr:hypothetical protein AXF42_Ash013346 [Apostasia shenzhenica]PKA65226.1 hypothetical protein AXF42_Ash013347 [Apostasia shenzhenica]